MRELAKEIKRQAESKRDLIADTRAIEPVIGKDGSASLHVANDEFAIREVAHGQIAGHTDIPVRYYDRMLKEAPELWGRNVKEWFHKYPAKRMLRVLDNGTRAFLSDSYRSLENWDFAMATLPVIDELDLFIMSAQITEKRLYLKVVDKRMLRDVPYGHKLGDGSHKFFHTLSPAAILSNSEVGYGSLSIESGIYTSQCTNLASIQGAGWKKRHLGARNLLGDDEQVRHLLTDETKRASDKALWLQVRDVLKGAFEEAKFQAHIDKLQGLTEQRIEGDVPKVVELAARKFGFNDDERKGVLAHLIEGGDLSRYGLFNAVTRMAEDVPSYDRASELERLGGDIVELPAAEWKELAKA
jgi:hypothetical protein